MRNLRVAAALVALMLPIAAQEGEATGKYMNEALGVQYVGIYGWESQRAEGSGAWTELVRYINNDYQALVILSVRNNTYGTTNDLRKALKKEFKEGGDPGPGKSVYKDVSLKDATMKRGNKLPAVQVEAIVTRVTESRDSDRYTPSADRLFESAAKNCGSDLLAVVLTGMGNDGRSGAMAVKRSGGKVIAESEETAVIFGMPQQAIRSGSVDLVLPLGEIPTAIQSDYRASLARSVG